MKNNDARSPRLSQSCSYCDESGLRERRLSRCDERLLLSLPLNKTSLTPFKTHRERHYIDSEGANNTRSASFS